MTFKKTLVLALATLFIGSANLLADEEKNISVFVNKVNDENAKMELKINGVSDTFELPELQEGESQSFTTQSGNQIKITKSDGNLIVLTGDGEEIVLPGSDHKAMVARVKALHTLDGLEADNSIQIVAEGLSEDQKEIIKSAIVAAGITKPVKFLEHGNFAFVVKEEFDHNNGQDEQQEFKWITKDGEHKKVKHIIIQKEEDQ